MGEEEKKAEEKKTEEGKKAAGGEENKEKKDDDKAAAEEKKDENKSEEAKDGKETKEGKEESPPPPKEIVLRVFMHCEGCARKVRRCLKGFPGVEDVMSDYKTNKVVVKGENADPLKVIKRIQRKSHRQVELISPIPKPPAPEEKKSEEEKEKPKAEEKKEVPQVVTVVLKVHMHCEACAQEIKKRILRMKGVESAESDLQSSEVTVKGVFDPPKLVEYVYKRAGKHTVIVKQDPENKEDDKEEAKESKEEKKNEGGDDKEKKEVKDNKEKKEEGGGDAGEESTEVELKKNEYYYYPQRDAMEMYTYPPPQIFSDENPNACSIM